MDKQNTISILNTLNAYRESCQELYDCAVGEDRIRVEQLFESMRLGLISILEMTDAIDTYGNKLLSKAVQSILDSLRRINIYFTESKLASCLKKIEFELLPLLAEAYQTYYVFQYLVEHPELLPDYYEKDIHTLGYKPYIQEALQTGHYKYEVSIIVIAYNKLDYTKQCVESLLKNLPSGLNYELILVNHGSNDGTKEYFESIHPHKQLDIAVNGGGVGAMGRIMEGEFTIQISNDVVITPHCIENLLACIRSDPKIAWAVPSTPNVSNLQMIPTQYENENQLTVFAQKNNQLDPYRWEQRVRLCNPIHILRGDISAHKDFCLSSYYHTLDPVYCNSFPDDRMSLLLRRNGYKMMLVKDAYCHHFGSVTLKDEINQQNEQKYYTEGRQIFLEAFGVDPWGTGCCFDPIFLERVVGEDYNHVEILGINCGLGSNSLKIKEQVKEYCHNTDCTLINLTDDGRFLTDLQGISDSAATITTIKQLKTAVFQHTFQYIVWETPFLKIYKFKTLFDLCLNHLSAKGTLLIKLTDQSKSYIEKKFSTAKVLGNGWLSLQKTDDFESASQKGRQT